MIPLNTPQDVKDWLEARDRFLDHFYRDRYRPGMDDRDHRAFVPYENTAAKPERER